MLGSSMTLPTQATQRPSDPVAQLHLLPGIESRVFSKMCFSASVFVYDPSDFGSLIVTRKPGVETTSTNALLCTLHCPW
jgi:hypothetical protein